MTRILVLCTGNSTRSQMAHGYLQHFAGPRAEVLSAGVETHGLNPRAVAVMAEDGIDISDYMSNHVDEYAHLAFDYVITVCDSAAQRCPVWIGQAHRTHHSFEDPSKFQTTAEDALRVAYRQVRDQIRTFSQSFVQQHLGR